VALVGETNVRIVPGIITELFSASTKESARFETTVDAQTIVLGTPLIDLSGVVIGMAEGLENSIFLQLMTTANE
jgi:hypothetical protein